MSESGSDAPVREVRLVLEPRPEFLDLAREAATLICEGLGLDEAARAAIGSATADALGTLDLPGGAGGEVEIAMRIAGDRLEIELRGGVPPADPAADPRLATARGAVDEITVRAGALVLGKRL